MTTAKTTRHTSRSSSSTRATPRGRTPTRSAASSPSLAEQFRSFRRLSSRRWSSRAAHPVRSGHVTFSCAHLSQTPAATLFLRFGSPTMAPASTTHPHTFTFPARLRSSIVSARALSLGHTPNGESMSIPTRMANKITGPNAGGPRQFPIQTPLAARVGQFWR